MKHIYNWYSFLPTRKHMASPTSIEQTRYFQCLDLLPGATHSFKTCQLVKHFIPEPLARRWKKTSSYVWTLVNWSNDWLIDWLIDWLTDWTDWLTGLTDWTDWLADYRSDWLTEWLNEGLIVWLIDWSMDCLSHSLIHSFIHSFIHFFFQSFIHSFSVVLSSLILQPTSKIPRTIFYLLSNSWRSVVTRTNLN